MSQRPSCDPFEIGTGIERATRAFFSGSCFCDEPCTPDKVGYFVQFYYTRRDYPYRRLNAKNPRASNLYNYKGHIKFLFHGYTEEATKGLNHLTKCSFRNGKNYQRFFFELIKGWLPPTGKQLSKVFNGYVILVDYGLISNCSYGYSVREIIPSVAQYTASLIKKFHFEPRNIELIGHSLGKNIPP